MIDQAAIKPLVSIITPVFNGGNYLVQAIESVLNQDYPNIEYIVLDDGSTDNTLEILQSYGNRLKWYSQSNMGQSSTLNKGWKMSQGELLGYLSADDVLFSNAISQLVEQIRKNDKAVAVFPNCDLIDPNNRIIKKSVCCPFDYAELVVQQECHIGPGALFQRRAFEIMGGWDSELRLAPDREFWMRIGLLGNIVMCPQTLALYRMHPQSLSYFQTDLRAADEYVYVIKKYSNGVMFPSP